MTEPGRDTSLEARALAALRDVPDFPRPGILFKDVTPLLADGSLFREVTAAMAGWYAEAGMTRVAGIESRGFILGAPIAQHLGVGFIPLRKPGKLPYERRQVSYALEYGTDVLEAHVDACPGDRVLLVDDVLATGGTAAAGCALVESVGGTVVGCAFLLSLDFLGGTGRLGGRNVRSLVRVAG
jgi:adenine phosphoribosyltransferase